jgi:predicted RNA binding protein YcfA (HicA-like mRNA interferase family)
VKRVRGPSGIPHQVLSVALRLGVVARDLREALDAALELYGQRPSLAHVCARVVGIDRSKSRVARLPRVFPSMRSTELLAILMRRPLDYEIVRQRGSHRHLRSSAGYPDLLFSWHDGVTLAPRAVRKVLVKDVGLPIEEALKLV